MTVKHLMFSDCTIHFKGMCSTQTAAEKDTFPLLWEGFGTKETFSYRHCMGTAFVL